MPMDKVVDLMSANPVMVELSSRLSECAEALVVNRIRHLPVVDGDGRLSGVVTDFALFEQGDWSKKRGWIHGKDYSGADIARDVVVRVEVTCKPGDPVVQVLVNLAKSLQDFAVVVDDDHRPVGMITEHGVVEEATWVLPADLGIDRFGSKEVITASAGEPATAAWKHMRDNQIRHVIIEADGSPCGVISYRDILEKDAEHDTSILCRDIASSALETVDGGVTMREVSETMARQKIGCTPVLDGEGALAGILTRTDVLIAVASHLAR